MVLKYEMYLSDYEFELIKDEAIKQLKSFTAIKCDGYFARDYIPTVVFIYIADGKTKCSRFEDFYKNVVIKKLTVAHYVATTCEFRIDYQENK